MEPYSQNPSCRLLPKLKVVVAQDASSVAMSRRWQETSARSGGVVDYEALLRVRSTPTMPHQNSLVFTALRKPTATVGQDGVLSSTVIEVIEPHYLRQFEVPHFIKGLEKLGVSCDTSADVDALTVGELKTMLRALPPKRQAVAAK